MGNSLPSLIQPHDLAAIKAVDAIEAEHADLLQLEDEESNLIAAFAGISVVDPIAANCRADYRATKTSGKRPLNVIKHIVMHSTEGSTARAAASWFQNPLSKGSAHICVDDTTCYRTLEDSDIPWGAKGANYSGFHIEQAGFAKWTTYIWSKTHRKTLNRAAFKAALHCKRYGIPIRFVKADGLKLGVAGITTHVECTIAFGGSHTDPGVGWPRTLFMGLVRSYAAVIKVRRIA